MRLRITVPPTRLVEREYVCRYVFETRLGLAVDIIPSANSRGITGTLIGGDDGGQIEMPDGLFAVSDMQWLTEACKADVRTRAANGIVSIPANSYDDLVGLFGHDASGNASRRASDRSIAFHYDALGTVFFLLTGMEEVINPVRDDHGRFPSSRVLSSHPEFSLRPIVDETIGYIAGCLNAIWPGLCNAPRGYRIRVSHDIDQPFLYHGGSPMQVAQRAARRVAGDFLFRKSARAAASSIGQLATYIFGGGQHDPNFKFDDLMNTSEAYGLKSCFYLIVDPNSTMDGTPYIDDPVIARQLQHVAARGHHIGLHASYACYGDSARSARETQKLKDLLHKLNIRQDCIGVRQHYLRWPGPEHWRLWADAGMSHDATMGFSDRMGFRCGTSHAFPVFDLRARTVLAIQERPLLLMDAAVMPLSETEWTRRSQEILDSAKRVIDACKAHGGIFELLWHNTGVQSGFSRAAYRSILDYASDETMEDSQ